MDDWQDKLVDVGCLGFKVIGVIAIPVVVLPVVFLGLQGVVLSLVGGLVLGFVWVVATVVYFVGWAVLGGGRSRGDDGVD